MAFILALGVGGKISRMTQTRLAPLTDSGRQLAPGAPWTEAMDSQLLGKLAKMESQLEAQGLWLCTTENCKFVGRFMVFRAKSDVPEDRLRILLEELAAPQQTDIGWPKLYDAQMQQFRFGDGVYIAMAQSNRGESGMLNYAGPAIDQVVTRVIPAQALADSAKVTRPKPAAGAEPPMPQKDHAAEQAKKPAS